jgi:hypothetical protein
VSENQNDNPNLQIILPSYASAVAAIGALTVALEVAVQAATFPDQFDDESNEARLNVLTDCLLCNVKNFLAEGMADYSEEATGVTAAIAIIRDIDDFLKVNPAAEIRKRQIDIWRTRPRT